jgi:hypothetical protein
LREKQGIDCDGLNDLNDWKPEFAQKFKVQEFKEPKEIER